MGWERMGRGEKCGDEMDGFNLGEALRSVALTYTMTYLPSRASQMQIKSDVLVVSLAQVQVDPLLLLGL